MHLNTDTEGASIQLSESPVKGDAKRKKGVTGGAGLGALSKLGKRSRETGMQVALCQTQLILKISKSVVTHVLRLFRLRRRRRPTLSNWMTAPLLKWLRVMKWSLQVKLFQELEF